MSPNLSIDKISSSPTINLDIHNHSQLFIPSLLLPVILSFLEAIIASPDRHHGFRSSSRSLQGFAH
jgi:hypothetical protein